MISKITSVFIQYIIKHTSECYGENIRVSSAKSVTLSLSYYMLYFLFFIKLAWLIISQYFSIQFLIFKKKKTS